MNAERITKSIIMIYQIDKQVEALQKNKVACVTSGCLLSAFDGPQKLSKGTIIILSANEIVYLLNQK